MALITRFLERKLRLKVNTEKSAVGRPWRLKFLGYTMTTERRARLKVSRQSYERLKRTLGEIFRRGRGRSVAQIIEELNQKLRGWINYFCLGEVKNIFEELDGWIRRRLRGIIWR